MLKIFSGLYLLHCRIIYSSQSIAARKPKPRRPQSPCGPVGAPRSGAAVAAAGQDARPAPGRGCSALMLHRKDPRRAPSRGMSWRPPCAAPAKPLLPLPPVPVTPQRGEQRWHSTGTGSGVQLLLVQHSKAVLPLPKESIPSAPGLAVPTEPHSLQRLQLQQLSGNNAAPVWIKPPCATIKTAERGGTDINFALQGTKSRQLTMKY